MLFDNCIGVKFRLQTSLKVILQAKLYTGTNVFRIFIFCYITVLIFGSGHSRQIADAIPFKTKFMGYLSDEHATMLVYNAADVFIAPSTAEAFGYVIMESLSCGTPVVAFEVGGVPEMIKHKENGYIAKYKDANDVCNGIKFCLQNNLKGSLQPEFYTNAIIKKHLSLFDEIKI